MGGNKGAHEQEDIPVLPNERAGVKTVTFVKPCLFVSTDLPVSLQHLALI